MVFAERVGGQKSFECESLNHHDSLEALLDKNISNALWSESKLSEAVSIIQLYQESKQGIMESANNIISKENVRDLKKLDSCLTVIFNTALHYQDETYQERKYPADAIESTRFEVENKLARRVINLKRVTDLLTRASESLNALDLQQKRNWLLNTSRRLAADMLIDIEELVMDSNLYSALPEVVGKKSTFLETYYNIANQGQLNDYLNAQRQRLFYIAANYVEPVVIFLIRTQHAEIENTYVVKKWIATLKQVERYKLKATGNQLERLESIFAQLLKESEGAECHRSIKSDSNIENDLFSNIKNKLLEYKTQFCIEKTP